MKCKIYNGQKIADVTGYLEEYPAVFVVADRNVARFAEEIAGCVSMPEGGKIFYINATEEDKSMQTVLDICKWLLVNDADRKIYIQSAFRMDTEQKTASELDSLLLTKDFFKKIIVRMDIPHNFYDENGIFHCNLIDLLLGRVELF